MKKAEQIKWVEENNHKYDSYIDIAKDFNSEFGTAKSINAIQQMLTKKLKIYLNTQKKASHFTKTEEYWLLINYKKFDAYKELTSAFNSEFGRNKKVDAIRDKCTKSLGLKGIKSKTTFKKGNIKKQLPIGTIRKSTNGSTYIKVMDSKYSYQSGYSEPYWLPIQKKIWIEHYGEVPDGKMIIFLDCNKNNLNIDNLYCIDRKISAVLATHGWYSSNSVITLTAIKWCELYYSIKTSGVKQ